MRGKLTGKAYFKCNELPASSPGSAECESEMNYELFVEPSRSVWLVSGARQLLKD